MKDQTYIKNYAKKNPNPDQAYCPDLMIYWRGYTKNGNWLKNYDPKSGNVFFSNTTWDRDHTHYFLSARSYYAVGVYFKPIRDGKILEIGFVKMNDMSRAKDGEIRKWVFYENWWFKRVFLVKETMVIYNEYGTEYYPEENGRYYNKRFVRGLMEMCHQGYVMTKNNMSVLKEFTGIDTPYIYRVIKWYKNARPRGIKENPLLSVELKEIKPTNRIVFEIINEDLAVFRLFYFTNSDYHKELNGKENLRIFVNRKGKVTILENNRKWLVKSTSSIYEYSYKEPCLHLNVNELKEFPALKYIADIMCASDNDIKAVNKMITLLRHPIVEMINKAGYPKLAKIMCKNSQIKANIKRYFGVDIKKETGSLTKLLGVNKYMLKKLEINCEQHYGSYYINHSPVGLMREFFEEKLQGLTESDINMYYPCFQEMQSKHGSLRYYLDPNDDQRYWYYYDNSRKTFSNDDVELKKIIVKLCKLGTTAVNAYMDAVQTYKRLTVKPEIDFSNFRKTEDITRLHDNLVGLLNAEQAMKQEERNRAVQEVFEKKQEKRIEKFEDTESDDMFEIIVPKSLTEITTEGQALSHCVGGYLERHGRGDTNIVFLRNKLYPSTPFYTIEVDNSGYVVQIHGKYNKWLGNNPEAIGFVSKWIKDRELRCEDYKLLETATGYGRSGSLVDSRYLIA